MYACDNGSLYLAISLKEQPIFICAAYIIYKLDVQYIYDIYTYIHIIQAYTRNWIRLMLCVCVVRACTVRITVKIVNSERFKFFLQDGLFYRYQHNQINAHHCESKNNEWHHEYNKM